MEDFCGQLHRSLAKDFKYGLVWGTSAKHYPQRCGLQHELEDEDVVQIVKRKVRARRHATGPPASSCCRRLGAARLCQVYKSDLAHVALSQAWGCSLTWSYHSQPWGCGLARP